jgi:hypothetical protein
METAGLEVRIDAAGNLIGRREGTDRKLPTIVVGSRHVSVRARDQRSGMSMKSGVFETQLAPPLPLEMTIT